MKILMLAVAMALTLAGANPEKPAPKPAAKAAAAKPDAEIERAIRARFAKSKIREDNFTVKVQGGVATIEGKTKVIQRKGVATRLAKLGGARSVENRVEIDAAAREKASRNLAEGRRRLQVKRSETR
jgi:hypothetical protein